MPNLLKKILRKAKRQVMTQELSQEKEISQATLKHKLDVIPYWEDKIDYYKKFEYSEAKGLWLNSEQAQASASENGELSDGFKQTGLLGKEMKKVNFGCGGNFIPGWLNVDLYEMNGSTPANYRSLNLLNKHPFEDNILKFGFSEDLLEHLNQADSILFLSEVYRTLAPGGVLRLSFPGLEGVLNRHYTPPTESRIRHGELEAYSFWDHIHFYAKGELEVVAQHLGFSKIEYPDYGVSQHPELSNLDTREDQIGLNTYVELTK
jgi:predicted SAM-dependent methyltransferase